jgi:hypothetical protein
MNDFSNSFFRDLPPRERRYDVPVGDQLVFCVFPNGVKTWVHVYPFEEFTRRRTIGLYPDMRFEQVRDAMEASRKIVELDSHHERRRIQVVRRSRGLRKIGMTIVAAAAGVAVSVLVARTLQGAVANSQSPISTLPVATPAVSSPRGELDPAAPMTNQVAIQASDSASPVREQADPEPLKAEAGMQSTIGEQASAVPATNPEIESTESETEQDLHIAEAGTPGTADGSVSDDPPVADVHEDVREAVVDAPEETPLVAVKSESEDKSGAETIVAPTTQAPPDAILRALLTDGIAAHEPTNELQGPIGIAPEDLRTIFFFTELKGLGGERISHHWKHLGNTIAAVPFDVRADGRWRVYSSKRISADQSGNWTVEVVTSDGVVLSTLAFAVETTPAD